MAAGNVIPYTTNMTDPVVSGGIDLDSDTIVCVLLGAGYTPNRTAHAVWSDVSAHELATGGGYTAGGQALSGKSVTHSAGTGTFDADNVAWNGTISAKYAVLVRRAGGSLANGDLLVAYADLNTDSGSAVLASTGAAFTVSWNAAGILTLTANAS